MFKVTPYFKNIRIIRKDRALIKDSWIQSVIDNPESTEVQYDGRIRLWGCIVENDCKYLRVVLLEDKETVHNAFFDRRYKP